MSKPYFGGRPHITALLIDISGTLHVGTTPTLNAVNSFHRLRESSTPFRLCSNTSKESSASLLRRLEDMGFEVSPRTPKGDARPGDRHATPQQLLWTSIAAAAQIVKSMHLKKPLLLLSESAREEVLAQLPQDKGDSRLACGISNAHYDSVVIGLAPSCFDYDHLNAAFRVLKGEQKSATFNPDRSGAIPLIATHKAKYIQTEDGLSLGPGPFVAALETATGVSAHVVGKPSKAFFKMVIGDFKLAEPSDDPDQYGKIKPINDGESQSSHRGKIAVIGDDVEADLGGGALELGLWRVLVRTGKYRTGDETRAGVVPPDEIYDSFSDFVDSFLR
ncbi:hypothetical protein CVT25_014797 [Psilocybe cyanescens]|uniref:Uncharacterized protein n=1 Tax=Psilocybe cyanescens TaxID=93625 RepID=A0A409X5C8_PSICY|nr:hypothetical protein CVT25_014797 [Psilocybe cyanescens]